MIKTEKKNIIYFQFNNLKDYEHKIIHFVSSRVGGFSGNGYASLNMGLHTDDDKKTVANNKTLLATEIGISPSKFVYANQVHDNHVKLIDEKQAGKGFFEYEDSVKATDAFICRTPEICPTLLFADCCPVLLYDKVLNVTAVIHAGWRSTVKKIVSQTIERMKLTFNSQPKNIIAGIGPCISTKNYEIGNQVVDAVLDAFGTAAGYLKQNSKTKRYHFDLIYANRKQLLENGVLPKNIEVSEYCTYADSDWFYSARYKIKTGRFAVGIMLVE